MVLKIGRTLVYVVLYQSSSNSLHNIFLFQALSSCLLSLQTLIYIIFCNAMPINNISQVFTSPAVEHRTKHFSLSLA